MKERDGGETYIQRLKKLIKFLIMGKTKLWHSGMQDWVVKLYRNRRK